jgi:hypothetical protein
VEEFAIMCYRFLGVGLLLAAVLALPALGAPAKKKKAGTPLDSENLSAGQFTGTVLTTPGSDRTFTVRIQLQQLQLKNPNQLLRSSYNDSREYQNLLRKQQQILQLQQKMASSRNPINEMNRIQQLMAQMQVDVVRQQLRPQQNPYKTVTSTRDVEFQVMEEVKVRTQVLPAAFDDKGNVKKYTAKELKELKGKDAHLPGYESSLENLTAGQVVQVTLAPRKKPKPVAGKDQANDKAKAKEVDLEKDKDKDKDLAKDKDLDKDKDTTTEKKMQVRMIVITKDDSASAPVVPAPRKK